MYVYIYLYIHFLRPPPRTETNKSKSSRVSAPRGDAPFRASSSPTGPRELLGRRLSGDLSRGLPAGFAFLRMCTHTCVYIYIHTICYIYIYVFAWFVCIHFLVAGLKGNQIQDYIIFGGPRRQTLVFNPKKTGGVTLSGQAMGC